MLKKGDKILTGDKEVSVRVQKFLRDKGIGWRDTPTNAIQCYGEKALIMVDGYNFVCTSLVSGSMTEEQLYKLFEEIDYEIY